MSDQIDWKARVEEMKRRAETIRTDEPDTWPFPDEAIANDYAALLSRITELEAEPDWKARALKAEGERDEARACEEIVIDLRDAAARVTGGNCTGADDDLAVLAHLADRAVGAGLTDGLHWQVQKHAAEREERGKYRTAEGVAGLILRTQEAEANSLSLQSKLTRLVEAAKAAQSFTSIMLASPFWREATYPVRGKVERINSALARTLSEALEGGDGSSVAGAEVAASTGVKTDSSEGH